MSHLELRLSNKLGSDNRSSSLLTNEVFRTPDKNNCSIRNLVGYLKFKIYQNSPEIEKNKRLLLGQY